MDDLDTAQASQLGAGEGFRALFWIWKVPNSLASISGEFPSQAFLQEDEADMCRFVVTC